MAMSKSKIWQMIDEFCTRFPMSDVTIRFREWDEDGMASLNDFVEATTLVEFDTGTNHTLHAIVRAIGGTE